jgi:hypothetical protein
MFTSLLLLSLLSISTPTPTSHSSPLAVIRCTRTLTEHHPRVERQEIFNYCRCYVDIVDDILSEVDVEKLLDADTNPLPDDDTTMLKLEAAANACHKTTT